MVRNTLLVIMVCLVGGVSCAPTIDGVSTSSTSERAQVLQVMGENLLLASFELDGRPIGALPGTSDMIRQVVIPIKGSTTQFPDGSTHALRAKLGSTVSNLPHTLTISGGPQPPPTTPVVNIVDVERPGDFVVVSTTGNHIYPGTFVTPLTPFPGPLRIDGVPPPASGHPVVRAKFSVYPVFNTVQAYFDDDDLVPAVEYRLRIRNDDDYGGLTGISPTSQTFRK